MTTLLTHRTILANLRSADATIALQCRDGNSVFDAKIVELTFQVGAPEDDEIVVSCAGQQQTFRWGNIARIWTAMLTNYGEDRIRPAGSENHPVGTRLRRAR